MEPQPHPSPHQRSQPDKGRTSYAAQRIKNATNGKKHKKNEAKRKKNCNFANVMCPVGWYADADCIKKQWERKSTNPPTAPAASAA